MVKNIVHKAHLTKTKTITAERGKNTKTGKADADPPCFLKRTIGKAMWQTGEQSWWKGY